MESRAGETNHPVLVKNLNRDRSRGVEQRGVLMSQLSDSRGRGSHSCGDSRIPVPLATHRRADPPASFRVRCSSA